MEGSGEEKRIQQRDYVEPYDTGTYLEFDLGGKSYRFSLLDTSPGGVGMLVKDTESEILKKIGVGDRIEMTYHTPEAEISMDFEIRHSTLLEKGRFKGHYQVGLKLFRNQ
ncbi:hypothetical protein ACFL9T_19940 [Thermodesulfobacteriota bacterium]